MTMAILDGAETGKKEDNRKGTDRPKEKNDPVRIVGRTETLRISAHDEEWEEKEGIAGTAACLAEAVTVTPETTRTNSVMSSNETHDETGTPQNHDVSRHSHQTTTKTGTNRDGETIEGGIGMPENGETLNASQTRHGPSMSSEGMLRAGKIKPGNGFNQCQRRRRRARPRRRAAVAPQLQPPISIQTTLTRKTRARGRSSQRHTKTSLATNLPTQSCSGSSCSA